MALNVGHGQRANWQHESQQFVGNKPIEEYILSQGLLELLWTVYSDQKWQSCLKLRNVQNPLKGQ